MIRKLALVALVLVSGGLPEAYAVPMSVQVDVRLYFDPSDDGIDIGETFFRPTVLYYDAQSPGMFQMNLASYIGDALPSDRNPQTFWTDFLDFRRPAPSTTVYGGFFGYYSYCDQHLPSCDGNLAGFRREGMFVGLSPSYLPVDDFDTTFGQGIWPLTETQALDSMKTPGPSPFDVFEEVFTPIYFSDAGVLPTWQFDTATGSYSIDMNIWAYSSPRPAGSMHATATFAAVPEPSSIDLLAGALMLLLVEGLRGRAAGVCPVSKISVGSADILGIERHPHQRSLNL